MSTLAHAIKTSIIATKEALEDGQTQHTELLNTIAARLGFKDFRALSACTEDMKFNAALATPASPVNQEATPDFSAFETLTLYSYTADELINCASYEVSAQTIESLFKLAKSSKECGANIPLQSEQETYVESVRCSIATGLTIWPNNTVEMRAQVFDKHFCTHALCEGDIDLDLLFEIGSKPDFNESKVGEDYIWHAPSRSLYLVQAHNDCLEHWMDLDDEEINELVELYFEQFFPPQTTLDPNN